MIVHLVPQVPTASAFPVDRLEDSHPGRTYRPARGTEGSPAGPPEPWVVKALSVGMKIAPVSVSTTLRLRHRTSKSGHEVAGSSRSYRPIESKGRRSPAESGAVRLANEITRRGLLWSLPSVEETVEDAVQKMEGNERRWTVAG